MRYKVDLELGRAKTMAHIRYFNVRMIIKKMLTKNKVYAVFRDLEKAYDRVQLELALNLPVHYKDANISDISNCHWISSGSLFGGLMPTLSTSNKGAPIKRC